MAATWARVVLALILGTALLLWPYDKSCGVRLFFYLGAAAVTLLAAVWGAASSWSHRRAVAHVLSLGVLLVAAVAAAHEILPRVGYAPESHPWLCPAQAAGAPAGGPPGAPPVQQP